MKIVILGSTGMLGHMVFNYFKSQEEYEVIGSVHNNVFIKENTFEFDPLIPNTWTNVLFDTDYIINCIGKIKPQMMKNIEDSIYINAVFPHKLANICKTTGTKLIHITTDCCYSGLDGNYNENSLHDALDEYGKSKSLGEPKNCMVIRTSIIGTETYNKRSLLEWVIAQAGKSIMGFNNHFWNGITTLQFAKVCDTIIKNNLYSDGLYHVYSPQTVNKYELVSLINEVYQIGVADIVNTTAPESVDRTLSSIKPLCDKLKVPGLKIQLQEMKFFGR